VTQWPRGLVGYVPSGDQDATPDPEEDRVRNRLLLAGRLIAVLRARGLGVDAEVAQLREAQTVFDQGGREEAGARVDRLIGALDARRADPAARTTE